MEKGSATRLGYLLSSKHNVRGNVEKIKELNDREA
jgi:hypothetical protein